MLNQETATSTPVEKPATETPATPLVLTDAAIGLRVYIISGGCSGYRYGMMVEETANADDQIFETNGVKVYLDEKSVPLVVGSSVDYVDSLMGAGFTVENPNSVGGCGCGSSFRTAESAGAPSACSH